jgi:hypothetical protein
MELNIVRIGPKKVTFEDIKIKQVFKSEGEYYMKVKSVVCDDCLINAVALSNGYATHIEDHRICIPLTATLSIEVPNE